MTPEVELQGLSWKPLLQANHLDGKAFVYYLEKSKFLCPATISLYICGVKSFYRELINCGITERNPFKEISIKRSLKKPTKPTQAIDVDLVKLLLSLPNRNTLVGKRDYAILCLLFGAALRKSEVLGLTYEDLIKEKNYYKLKLLDTKTSNYDEHSLAGWVSDALLDWVRVSPKGKKIFSITSSTVNYLFKKYIKQANIEGRYSPHSGRATAITTLLAAGYTHREVQLFSRHGSIAMVEMYDRRVKDLLENPGLRLIYGGRNEEKKSPIT